jgi:CHAT domain-containing protein
VASPSLGDAFIDAGARAVVGTFWSVRDDAAARAMREFARVYDGRGADAVAALCASRRRMLHEGASAHEWAAYAITLGGL